MQKHLYAWLQRLLALLLCCATATSAWAQVNVITGRVVDAETNEPMIGVNISVVGKVSGTLTDKDGNFRLTINDQGPIQLRISYVGYASQVVEAKAGGTLNISLAVQDVMGNEVVVSASRVSERVIDAPVTIEKMDAVAVQQTASANYYQGLQNLKGVDVATSSIGFQIYNTRGFNSTGNTRFVQIIDGMDAQAPVLNFPISNLNGPSELDIQSVEFVPGASSALYGPQAFSGAIVMQSKDPFNFQGLSAFVKSGAHVTRPSGPTMPVWEGSLRYAKAFNDRFAFKVNLSYFAAEDWNGRTFSDLNTGRQGDLSLNPAYNGVHTLGDESEFNMRLVTANAGYVTLLNTPGALPISNGYISLKSGLGLTDAQLLPRLVPSQFVSRTGYDERYLVDYNARNVKGGLALHYRISDNAEAILQYNGGFGTSVYTGAQRYSLKNFSIQQFKAELKGDNYFLRGYYTLENSGDSYIADATGAAINEAYSPTSTAWLPTYTTAYIGTMFAGLGAGLGATIGSITDNSQLPLVLRNQGHFQARTSADGGRFQPGSDAFRTAFKNGTDALIPAGGRFNDRSGLVHVEGQYDFKNQIDFMDLQFGASFRRFLMSTGGTILDDAAGDISIDEYGAFLQAGKRLFDNKLRLTASVRYDKNQNFEGQINPRFAAQWQFIKNHNLRVSYQTGFRFPTTQGQYINLDVVTSRLLGGLPSVTIDRYQLNTNTYTEASVLAAAAFAASQPGGFSNPANALAARSLLVSYNAAPVKPERVASFEVGYKAMIDEKLFIDMAYYYSDYRDFISQVFVRRVAGDPFSSDPTTAATFANVLLQSPRLSNSTLAGPNTNPSIASTFYPYTNSDKRVNAQGFVFGAEYSLPANLFVSTNYNWNKLNTEVTGSESLIYSFNTPEHKANVSFGSRRIFKNGAFNVTWRWQDAFLWESSFAIGRVPAYSTLDAQVSYKLPNIKTIVKIGGQNLLNHRYFTNFGGPELGAIYYVSLTFDQLMN